MLSIGIISLYTTYAYEGENIIIQESNSDKNFVFSLKNSTNKEVSVAPNEEKFFDINLTNTYETTVRYGAYYYMINPERLPENVIITLAEGSEDELENIIKPQETRSISLQITNNSEYSINLIIGAIIGYEYGNMEELEKNGVVLIK